MLELNRDLLVDYCMQQLVRDDIKVLVLIRSIALNLNQANRGNIDIDLRDKGVANLVFCRIILNRLTSVMFEVIQLYVMLSKQYRIGFFDCLDELVALINEISYFFLLIGKRTEDASVFIHSILRAGM